MVVGRASGTVMASSLKQNKCLTLQLHPARKQLLLWWRNSAGAPRESFRTAAEERKNCSASVAEFPDYRCAKRNTHRQMAKTSMGVVFGWACPGGRWQASPATHFGTPPREHKHYDSRGFGSYGALGRGHHMNRNLGNHSVCARGVVPQSESPGSLAADLPDTINQTLRSPRF